MEKVYEEIKQMKEAQRVAMLTGPYDVMVLARGDSVDEISYTLMNKIRKMNGVKETTTNVVFG